MNIRRKLMAATAMLLVSAIMMTTASFAWFTISTNPEVKTMTSGVTVNQNLEIALAHTTELKDANDPAQGYALPALPDATKVESSKDYYTWGNLINLQAEDLDNVLTVGTDEDGKTTYTKENDVQGTIADVDLRPVALTTVYEKDDQGEDTTTVDKRQFTAPKYGSDGRVSDVDGLVLTESGTYGVGVLQDTYKETEDGADKHRAYGYYVDLWVRTNMTESYTLGLTEPVVTSDSTTVLGAGSKVTTTSDNATFNNNVKIAVKVLATSTDGTTIDAVDADAPAEIINAASENTATTADGVTTYNLTSTNLLGRTMVANTAYLIRVYVFLDGATVTNAAANQENVKANVTLQFALYNAEQRIDLQSMESGGVGMIYEIPDVEIPAEDANG